MTGGFPGDTGTTLAGSDPGEQHAHELADKIRQLAATDPRLAQDLVDQLVAGLDRATGGAFRDHLCAAEPAPVDRQPSLAGAEDALLRPAEPDGRAGSSAPGG